MTKGIQSPSVCLSVWLSKTGRTHSLITQYLFAGRCQQKIPTLGCTLSQVATITKCLVL